MNNWSSDWKSSTNPSKQRKYRDNAPLHVKDKLVSANVTPEIRDELGTRSITLHTGDLVKVMRGDEAGKEGIIHRIDREDGKVYVNGINTERNDGTERDLPLRPSNLQIQALNIEDDKRLEKYDVEDLEAIGVEEDEMEEALEEEDEGEMMKQMQTGESSLEADEEVEEEIEEEEVEDETEEEPETEDTDANYQEIVSENIGDAKDALQELENVDYKAALQAEKDNKDRKTFKKWLENKVE